MKEIAVRIIDNQDLQSVATLHMQAFPDSAFTKLGIETVRRYYSWQFEGPHDLIALGAFEEAEMQGCILGGYFRGAMIGFLRKNWKFLFITLLFKPWVLLFDSELREVAFEGAIYFLNNRNPDQPGFSQKRVCKKRAGILAIAVAPAHQRSGVGRALVTVFEQQALKEGYEEISLSVKKKNGSAINFYEQMGWVVSEGKKDSYQMVKRW